MTESKSSGGNDDQDRISSKTKKTRLEDRLDSPARSEEDYLSDDTPSSLGAVGNKDIRNRPSIKVEVEDCSDELHPASPSHINFESDIEATKTSPVKFPG